VTASRLVAELQMSATTRRISHLSDELPLFEAWIREAFRFRRSTVNLVHQVVDLNVTSAAGPKYVIFISVQ